MSHVWKNRLEGDDRLPVTSRLTWAFYPFYKADATLVESGLLGPFLLLGPETVGPSADPGK